MNAPPRAWPPSRTAAARAAASCLLGLLVLLESLGLPALAAAAPAGAGEDSCAAPSPDCVAVGHWNFSVALGGGVRTNPLAGAENIPLVLVPHVSYYGEHFFLDDLDLGVTLFENDANAFNLVASPGYDRVYFYRSDLQNIFIGIPPSDAAAPETAVERVSETTPGAFRFPQRDRRWTYLAGPEWTFKYAGITGQFDFLHEITEQNHGNEIRAALGFPLLQASGQLSADIGITWNSAAYVNYYYGASGVYAGGSALDPFIKLGYGHPLSSKWRFNAFIEYEHLASAIAASPIVDQNHVVTVFAGAVYTF
jgi:outer membrane protein